MFNKPQNPLPLDWESIENTQESEPEPAAVVEVKPSPAAVSGGLISPERMAQIESKAEKLERAFSYGAWGAKKQAEL